MSMRQMSKMVGISNPYLSQIERGLRAPSASVTAAIATTLGITVEELYEQSGVERAGRPGVSDLARVIDQASELTAAQRTSLLEIYHSFVAVNRALSIDRNHAKNAVGE